MSGLRPHNDKDDGLGEQLQHGFQIGITREVKLVHRVSAQQCEEDIEDLKKQLIDKNKEIGDLRKRVKELETKNSDLEFQLKNKCSEVNNLNKRIRKLEEEKKSIEQELESLKVNLASVNLNLKTVKETVAELSDSREVQERTNYELERKNFELEREMRDVTTSLENVEEENKQLKAEIQQVRRQQRYVGGAPLRLPVPAEEQHTAMMILRQMASCILSAMYKKVLPDHYTSMINYTVAMIDDDIKSLTKTDEERSEAIKRWENLKESLSWTEDKAKILKTLQESRNPIEWSFQDLDEQVIRECTNYLHQENILKGWLNIDHIAGLIEVWKRLNSSTTLVTKN